MNNLTRIFRLCLVVIVLMTAGVTASAQQVQIERRSKSVFLFPEFRNAKIVQAFGRFVMADVNFHIGKGELCFLDSVADNKKGGMRSVIKKAYVKNVFRVEVDSLTFMKVDSVFGRVVARDGRNFLIDVVTVDKKKYGSEITDLNTMQNMMGGIQGLGSLGNMDTDRAMEELEEQVRSGYPLKDTYYFNIRGKVVPATEKQVKACVRSEMKTAFKNLMGDRFWSWKDPDCLKQLFMYF